MTLEPWPWGDGTFLGQRLPIAVSDGERVERDQLHGGVISILHIGWDEIIYFYWSIIA